MGDLDWAQLSEQVGAVLTSPTALWVYSWIAMALTLASLVAYAFWQLRIIRDFNEADMVLGKRGRPPEKPESIQNRIDTLRSHAGSVVGTLIGRATRIASFGIILPGFLLAALAFYQDWFLPGPPALILGGTASPASDVSIWRLLTFVLDQALRGGLSDAFEVFGLSVSPVTNNPDNLAFAGFVFSFRLLCGAVVVAIGVMILRILMGVRTLDEAISVYQDELERARQRPGSTS